MLHCEPSRGQQTQIGCQCAMLLDNALGQPVSAAWSLDQVAVDWPFLVAIVIRDPPGRAWRGVDRMLDREYEPAARNQRAMHDRQQSVEPVDVMQRQRAVGEIKGSCR